MIIVGEDYRFTQRRIQTPIWRQHNLELRVKNANFELSWDCGQNKQQAFFITDDIQLLFYFTY